MEFTQNDIDALFTTDFKKIINGKVEVTQSKDLLAQLTRVREWCGGWTDIKVAYIIPAADSKHCFLRYTFTSTLQGKYDVIALVTITNWKISKFDEIYIKLENPA